MSWGVTIFFLANLVVTHCCSANENGLGIITTTKRPNRGPYGPGPESPDWSGVGWGRPPNTGEFWGKGGMNPKLPAPGEPGFEDHPALNNNPHLSDGWRGIGTGSEGVAPPQWSYYPKNVGKPSFCFKPPIRGICEEKQVMTMQVRYAFNPFVDKCQPFPYSGCRGNENNFKSENRCNELCKELPGPDCDPGDDPPEIKHFIAAMNG